MAMIDGGPLPKTACNSKETHDAELAMENPLQPTFWQHLNTDVDPAQSTGPLTAFCFMTGFMNVISFSAIFVWCGFQTGNFVQLSIAIARLLEHNSSGVGRDTAFRMADRQAITSLLSFNAGAFFGRLGDRMGSHKRSWLLLSTFVQVLLTMAAALVIWKSGQDNIAAKRGDRSWTNALTFIGLAFMSASLGIQGIVGKRLNTQFNATLVLTTVWIELVTDPRLFNIRQKVITRDHRLIAVVALLGGAFISRVILTQIGAAGALCVGAGVRVLIAFAWIVIPGKPAAQ
ncbi:Aldedh domain-containing protein [Mycena venus]|uniref:Aldedh domain-containing protein n=1 Tax=Mycena venus TaxID=2733690 RepID=A0A8H6YRE2_9AGAR|nr:Aldedh domain-containing protein [Mycena venus]